MKFQKPFFALVISLSLFHAAFGQGLTESRLVDYFGKIINDDLQGRVVYFMNILNKNNSHGYIVLYGENVHPLATYINERRIQGCLLLMKYSSDNLSFIFTNDKPEVGVQFWESPSGSRKPQFNEIPHDYKLTKLTKPHKIYMVNVDDDFCPLRFDMEFYSRFLNADPNIAAKIVIYEKTLRKYQKERL